MEILKKIQSGDEVDDKEEQEGQGSPTSLHSVKPYVESDYVILTPGKCNPLLIHTPFMLIPMYSHAM